MHHRRPNDCCVINIPQHSENWEKTTYIRSIIQNTHGNSRWFRNTTRKSVQDWMIPHLRRREGEREKISKRERFKSKLLHASVTCVDVTCVYWNGRLIGVNERIVREIMTCRGKRTRNEDGSLYLCLSLSPPPPDMQKSIVVRITPQKNKCKFATW